MNVLNKKIEFTALSFCTEARKVAPEEDLEESAPFSIVLHRRRSVRKQINTLIKLITKSIILFNFLIFLSIGSSFP